MTVMDIVYRPLRTKLLHEAEEQGCKTIDGLEMLAYQGAAQLEIWVGQSPDGRTDQSRSPPIAGGGASAINENDMIEVRPLH